MPKSKEKRAAEKKRAFSTIHKWFNAWELWEKNYSFDLVFAFSNAQHSLFWFLFNSHIIFRVFFSLIFFRSRSVQRICKLYTFCFGFRFGVKLGRAKMVYGCMQEEKSVERVTTFHPEWRIWGSYCNIFMQTKWNIIC